MQRENRCLKTRDAFLDTMTALTSALTPIVSTEVILEAITTLTSALNAGTAQTLSHLLFLIGQSLRTIVTYGNLSCVIRTEK